MALQPRDGVIKYIYFNLIYIYKYVYMCSWYLCILLFNRVPWKNSVTEWFTLYDNPHPPTLSNFPIHLRHP